MEEDLTCPTCREEEKRLVSGDVKNMDKLRITTFQAISIYKGGNWSLLLALGPRSLLTHESQVNLVIAR